MLLPSRKLLPVFFSLTAVFVFLLLSSPYENSQIQAVLTKVSHQPHPQQSTQYAHNEWTGYSIKPIAYVFPQYYAFSENDDIWGVNFTEWDNVRKVTMNVHGLETIRPHESVGYYNGIDFATRQRQGNFLRESGFYGATFHHYWFAGKPVMDGVIKRMLEDGEPNIPFMLSWANEPWTARWDGMDSSETFIAQSYGLIDEWRAHFDWLLPFFRHPRYIKSEGRVQFQVYSPQHMGKSAPEMFAAWRQWAVEAGLGGMDVIETRWGGEKWSDFPPDAVNEFQPHVMGFDHSRHPMSKRVSRVYHRGTLVCWDSTPRHSTEPHMGLPQPVCHPKTWQWNVVEMMRRIKQDPNPRGAENFLFVNALNEWGEGNALEPSQQFGFGYGAAMRNAISISNERHQWRIDDISTQQINNQLINATQNSTIPDVCVLVQTHEDHSETSIYKLSVMLESLRKLENTNWRAIIYQTDRENFGFETLVHRALDTRLTAANVPDDFKSSNKTIDGGYKATDWVVKNMKKIDGLCAKANYVLFASGGNLYEPPAFNAMINSSLPADIYALSVESAQTIRNKEVALPKDILWHDRCLRFKLPTYNACQPSTFTNTTFTLAATLFSLPKYLATRLTLTNMTSSHLLPSHLKDAESWTFAHSTGTCLVKHNPTYSTCVESGNFWFDTPWSKDVGCYSVTQFNERFGFDHNTFDLVGYREHGQCLRYTRETYAKELEKSKSVNGTLAPLPVKKIEMLDEEKKAIEEANAEPVDESWKFMVDVDEKALDWETGGTVSESSTTSEATESSQSGDTNGEASISDAPDSLDS